MQSAYVGGIPFDDISKVGGIPFWEGFGQLKVKKKEKMLITRDRVDQNL